jgi:hypothetical protein
MVPTTTAIDPVSPARLVARLRALQRCSAPCARTFRESTVVHELDGFDAVRRAKIARGLTTCENVCRR